jgi:hypothetical protein
MCVCKATEERMAVEEEEKVCSKSTQLREDNGTKRNRLARGEMRREEEEGKEGKEENKVVRLCTRRKLRFTEGGRRVEE